MTSEEAIDLLDNLNGMIEDSRNSDYDTAFKMAIKALEQEPCEDCISRERTMLRVREFIGNPTYTEKMLVDDLNALPSVTQQPKMRWCKDCKYFEYDSVAKVDGIPLIVAHEICSRWGDGRKTKEDGHCFLFEPQERSDKE